MSAEPSRLFKETKDEYLRTVESDINGLFHYYQSSRFNEKEALLRNIKILKSIFDGDGFLTQNERLEASKFSGWGSLAKNLPFSFNGNIDASFQDIFSIVNEDEYDSFIKSSETSYFTPDYLIKILWYAAIKMGFNGGRAIDIAGGIGNFCYQMPEYIKGDTDFTILEKDILSAKVAAALNLDATVINGDFIKFFPEKTYDLVISNVPFSSLKPFDPVYVDEDSYSLHDYFIRKGIDILSESGILIAITSSWTADRISEDARKNILKNAELINYLRLPSNTFLNNNNINISSDIIFLKKRSEPLTDENFNQSLSDFEHEWLKVHFFSELELVYGVAINSLLVKNKEQIIGSLVYAKNRFNDSVHRVEMHDFFIDDILSHVECLPCVHVTANNYDSAYKVGDEYSEDELEDYEIDNYLSFDGEKWSIVETLFGKKYRRAITVDLSHQKVIKPALIVRDLMLQLTQAESIDAETATIEGLRALLNKAYDKFFTKNPIAKYRWPEIFENDPWFGRFISLENWDEKEQVAKKSDIFNKRLIHNLSDIEFKALSVEDALYQFYNETGSVDVDEIASRIGEPRELVYDYLIDKKLVFKTPNIELELAPIYLSGDIAEKISAAKEAGLDDNVAELLKVLPDPIYAENITVNVGASWIKPLYIGQFIREIFGYEDRSNIEVIYDNFISVWSINIDHIYKDKSKGDYGTDEYTEVKILESLLNGKILKVTQKHSDGSITVDIKKTLLVQEKSNIIKTCFIDWLWGDFNRKEELEKIYNQRNNSYVEFNPASMPFVSPDINKDIVLRENQINAASKGIVEGRLFAVHPVGSGKTYTQGIIAHEWKRRGYCRKPMIVVKNNSLNDFTRHIQHLYPKDKILSVSIEELKGTDKKNLFFGLVANNDWDMVIITHSFFSSLRLSDDETIKQLRLDYAEMTQNLAAYSLGRDVSDKDPIKKEYVRILNKIEQKINKIDFDESKRRNKFAGFEYLNIDSIIVDEIHHMKNDGTCLLGRDSSSTLSLSLSSKAIDLKYKLRWLSNFRSDCYAGTKAANYKCFMAATATLLSNNVLELFVMQKMVINDYLEKNGINNINSWAKNFIGSELNWEPSILGNGFSEKERPYYINAPELKRLNSIAFDIRNIDLTKVKVPEERMIIEKCALNAYQERCVEETLCRAEQIKDGLVDKKEDNMLSIMTDSKFICLDHRMYRFRDTDISDALVNDQIYSVINSSKIDKLCQNVYREYQESSEIKGTQLIFSDVGVNKINGFGFYQQIKSELMKLGIPECEIVTSDYVDSEQKREKLVSYLRKGNFRVVIGSTEKFGEAMNAQDLMVAIHHVDIPWRPKDFNQRNGRAVRSGNINDVVNIYYYIAYGDEHSKIKGSVESYIYWLMEVKRKNLHDFIYGSLEDCERVININGIESFTYAEMAAIASGDENVKEKLILESEIRKLHALKSAYASQEYRKVSKANEYINAGRNELNRAKYYIESALLRDDDYVSSGYNEEWHLLTDVTALMSRNYDGRPIVLPNNVKLLEFIRKLKSSTITLYFKYRGYTIKYQKEGRFSVDWIIAERNFSHYTDIGDFINKINDKNYIDSIIIKGNELTRIGEALKVETGSGSAFTREDELREKLERLDEIDRSLNEANKTKA
jgi:N12 class adenine-specific DNA methylase